MSGRPVYNSMGDVVRDVFGNEGFFGFYRGIGANFAKLCYILCNFYKIAMNVAK